MGMLITVCMVAAARHHAGTAHTHSPTSPTRARGCVMCLLDEMSEEESTSCNRLGYVNRLSHWMFFIYYYSTRSVSCSAQMFFIRFSQTEQTRHDPSCCLLLLLWLPIFSFFFFPSFFGGSRGKERQEEKSVHQLYLQLTLHFPLARPPLLFMQMLLLWSHYGWICRLITDTVQTF